MWIWGLDPLISWMTILFGGDDGGADGGRARNRDPGDGRGDRSHGLCHRVRVQSGALIFFWQHEVDQLHGELNLAMAFLNGDGVDDNHFLKTVELVSATK